MAEKPKIAFYWCASCGGCEEAVLDLAEAILEFAATVEIVFWPVAMDFKRKDVETMPDGSIQITFLNGGIRTTEQEEMAQLLRKKSALLVALGSCSQEGGIPGLANLFDRDSILKAVYVESPSTVNPEATLPAMHSHENGHAAELPDFSSTVRTLDQVVKVDYYVPGCPPTARIFRTALQTLFGVPLPPTGTVLAPDHALCEECPRRDTKPEKLFISEFKRPQEVLIDDQKCLLEQSLLCMGPATRAGCEASCIRGNMPCSGCGGPTSRVEDQGAKTISFISSLLESKDEVEIEHILNSIPDAVGTFYRYSLPGSLLHHKKLNGVPRS